MKNTIVGFLAVALFAPTALLAYVDCRENINGCTVGQLIEISGQTHLATADRISALQDAIKMLLAQIAQIKPAVQPAIPATCFVPLSDLYIGKTDAMTNGEVTKLQNFLLSEGYGDPDGDSGFLLQKATGYYGEKTAAAVMKWQKAHGMDFVTLKSGVGKQTRAKMQTSCSTSTSNFTNLTWVIEKANPNNTNEHDWRSYEQAISVDVTYSDGRKVRHSVGKALGCEVVGIKTLEDGTSILGRVSCYYAATGVAFTAFGRNGRVVIEQFNDDASGLTAGKKTVVLEI